MYKKYVKRFIDILLSALGLIILSPFYLILALMIKINDPGPVFFKQKRIGIYKTHFDILKFRTMKCNTPKDMPTHLLENPEQYITTVGRFLRKTSFDEFPQIWNILIGQMSIIGPRPALWNQDDLIEERDKYGANDIKPGLTGWAQINGRDELDIDVKARLDGEYAEKIGFMMDVRCFLRTMFSVLKSDGVVEGGTGAKVKSHEVDIKRRGGHHKMKIVVLSSHTSSLFWFRIDMMKDFIKHGHSVVAFGPEPESNWKGKFEQNGIRYRQFFVERNGINPLNDFKTYRELKKFMKEEKPDKIFAYQAKTVVYGSLAGKANDIHEVYPLIAGLGSVFRGKGVKNSIIKTVMKAEYRLACNASKKVFFQNNDDTKEFINNGLIQEDKVVIINGSGVNLEKFKSSPLPDTPVFLFVGRLIKDKGVIEYLEACKRIKAEYPEARCLLVGPYDSNPTALQSDELQPFIDQGIIEYFGEQTDVRPFFKQCSIYVLPSYHEGTPKTVLEAMATGRSIITSDAPGCRETVIDGYNGYLVAVKDIDGLVRKMRSLIEDPETNRIMAEHSMKLAKEKYDVNLVNASIMGTMGLL